ncbi:hypothetical protein ILUMI_07831 [Ignelater luminosus]|uniref:CRAL-TRIO domain-containing protein n=1 Tax=Ignelater luminosus TaxID=2038154 RepID=A0A8K0GE04_IGNLU|nr:hypothetical protein ILUMI_07831 [Ignelater luminosus]
MSTRKWLTEPDEYVCTLPEETQRIAREELREDDNIRSQALASMRHWIMNNPRIVNCRLDAKFLLRFLRSKKFCVPQAQVALEQYLLLRQTFGVAFSNLDIRIPMMEELTDQGFILGCPNRDSQGRRIMIARPGVFDLYQYTNADMLRLTGIACETLLEDEENQIRGLVYFADGQGVGLSYLSLFTLKEAVRLVKNGERILPVRHKEVHGINVHPSMKFLCDFGTSLVSDKIKKRIKIYSDLNDFINNGNMDLELLPKEYGGSIPMSEMIASWKEELRKSHGLLLLHDQMCINENLFSAKEKEGAVSALKRGISGVHCGGEEDPLYGVTGNFRKLEVD